MLHDSRGSRKLRLWSEQEERLLIRKEKVKGRRAVVDIAWSEETGESKDTERVGKSEQK